MIAKTPASLLNQFCLFDALTETERTRLNHKIVPLNRPKGNILFLSSVAAPVLYLIHRGQVKLSRYSDDGREIILDFRQAGEVIGELALLDWQPGDEIAEVTDNAIVSTLSINELRALLNANAAFSQQVTQLVVQRLKRMQSRYESLCFQGASSRIRQFIREQADEVGHRIGTEIDVRMTLTHQDIAKRTITSRQLVTGVLRELKRQNVITYNRSRMLIRDYQALLQ